MRGQGEQGYVILGFRVPTTSVGARGEGERGARRVKGSEGEQGYVILDFRVPIICEHKKFDYHI